MSQTLRRTPLFDQHVALGAKMIGFSGWEMPVWFEGLVKEHTAVRESTGVFDISHMGLLQLEGPDALPVLDSLFTWSLKKVKPWRAKYGLMCNETGGILDDVIVYRADDHLRIVVNAGNVDKITGWIKQHLAGKQARLTEDPREMVKLAIQGPKTAEMVEGAEPRLRFSDLPKFGWRAEGPRMVASTGYTGGAGLVRFTSAEEGRELYDRLTKELGVAPAGLGARDTLRLEHGLSLYGNEITEATHPFEAGLAWVVDLEKDPFVGQQALRTLKEAGNRTLVGLVSEGGASPRHGDQLVDEVGKAIGEVTSGSHSPSLGKPIALGYVPRQHSQPGHTVYVLKGGKPRPLTVSSRKFLG